MIVLFQHLFLGAMIGLSGLWSVLVLIAPNATYTINGVKTSLGPLGRILGSLWGFFCMYIWWTLIP